MKKIIFVYLCFTALFSLRAIGQLNGIVISNNVPIQNVLVYNVTQNIPARTDVNGKFTIAANVGDEINFSHPIFILRQISVTAAKLNSPELIRLSLVPPSQSAPQAPSSTWIGAKIGYNFDGFDDDENDFIGAAKIKLNLVKRDEGKFADYGVIGNISDFISKANKEDSDKDLQQLILSVTGLNIGMFGEWTFKRAEKDKQGTKRTKRKTSDGKNIYKKTEFSTYLTAGYRLNTYKYVTDDSVTVNLSQFKTSAGFQFEGLNFTEKGALNVSIEGSLYLFDPNRYKMIFNEEKKILVSLEIGAIIPIKEKIGLFVSGTMAPNTKGVLLVGIIIKPE